MAKGDTCHTEGCATIITRRGFRCVRCVYLKGRYGSYSYKPETREEFFWRMIKKTPTCWLWNGNKNPDGYGTMRKDGKPVSSHRLSWVLHNGDIPDGLCVLHKCDVRNCVNPKHLFLGTHKENMEDMSTKGRHGLGNRKLTLKQIKEVKKLIKEGQLNRVIAKKFNIDASTVSNIKHNKHWRDVK